MDEDIDELMQDLMNRLNSLKNRYPDCIWLKECLKMNHKDQEQTVLPELSSSEIKISLN